MVSPTPYMGTVHRNHCPYCLHSLHVDTSPGNRSAQCRARMRPVGLAYKHDGVDRYGKQSRGDVMIVHHCACCGTYNTNRIAADDCCEAVLAVFETSLGLSEVRRHDIEASGIRLLKDGDEAGLRVALFGKTDSG